MHNGNPTRTAIERAARRADGTIFDRVGAGLDKAIGCGLSGRNLAEAMLWILSAIEENCRAVSGEGLVLDSGGEETWLELAGPGAERWDLVLQPRDHRGNPATAGEGLKLLRLPRGTPITFQFQILKPTAPALVAVGSPVRRGARL